MKFWVHRPCARWAGPSWTGPARISSVSVGALASRHPGRRSYARGRVEGQDRRERVCIRYAGTATVKKACGTWTGRPRRFLIHPLNQPGNRVGELVGVTSRWTLVPICWSATTESVIAEVVPRLMVHCREPLAGCSDALLSTTT